MSFKIALRNILRNKRRTLLTGMTTMFGIFFFILMDSMMSGMDRGAIENMIRYTESSLKIQTKEYHNEEKAMPLKFGIREYPAIRDFLYRQKDVKGVTRRTRFLGEVSVYENAFRVTGIAVDPKSDEKVFRFRDIINSGHYFDADGKDQVLIGRQLAKDLGVETGDSIVVSARTPHGVQNAVDLEVVGIFDSSEPMLNGSTLLISYAEADDFLDLDHLIGEVNVYLNWPKGLALKKYLKRIDHLRERFREHFQDYTLLTFRELGSVYLALIKQKMLSGYLLLFFMLLIAAVGIFNSVLMSVYERIREIGVLKALGFQPNEIVRIFMFEGLLIGFLGSLMGLILGALTNLYLVNVGYDISAMTKGVDTTGFPIWGMMYGQWNPLTFLWVFVFGIVVAVLAAWIPARKAAQMNATYCLRFV